MNLPLGKDLKRSEGTVRNNILRRLDVVSAVMAQLYDINSYFIRRTFAIISFQVFQVMQQKNDINLRAVYLVCSNYSRHLPIMAKCLAAVSVAGLL
jgi:hypothetical protein